MGTQACKKIGFWGVLVTKLEAVTIALLLGFAGALLRYPNSLECPIFRNGPFFLQSRPPHQRRRRSPERSVT